MIKLPINETRYPTKPAELWPKMKELRRWHFRKTWEAQAKGAPVIQGIVQAFQGYLSGLGEFANPSFGPYYTMMMRQPEENIKCHEAMEARGWGRDLCSSMRLHLGQMFRGLSTRGPKGDTVIPNFVFQYVGCHSMGKTGQLFTEHLGVPYFPFDVPYEETPEAHEYLVNQLAEGIEWMEKQTGIKYDDEKAVEGTRNEWQSYALMTKIFLESQNIPAPWDYRQLWSLRLPAVTMRHEAAVVQYLRELLDETRERVRQGISARGYEKIRLIHDGIPPFYRINLLRYPAEYGAIIVGGPLLFGFGTWRYLPDGTMRPLGTLEEEGRDIRTREDVLQTSAELYIRYRWHAFSCCNSRPEHLVKMMEQWQCHGAVLHEDRGCKAEQCAMAEGRLALQDAGYPTMLYEASQADPRDFSESQVWDRFDSFLESFGLTRVQAEDTWDGGDAAVASEG